MALGTTSVTYPRALLVALGLAIAVSLVVAASTSTAAFGAYNPRWDGAADLRETADAAGTDSEVALNTTRHQEIEEGETVAVVLSPDEPYGPEDAARLRRFVRSGGTLVVAEDFGPHGNPLLSAVGADARFDGSLLRDERYNYRSPAMPVARNVSSHPSLTGVDALTLNYGTVVEPNDATVLARSSGFGYLDTNRNAELDDTEAVKSYPVATAEPVGEGRVVAVSDPSLFINAMLDRPGNRQFVRNLFAAHEVALLDYSHAGRLPVLAVAVLVVRRTPTLQVLLGIAGLAVVSAWGRGLFGSVARRSVPGGRIGGRIWPAESGDAPGRNRADVDAIATYLRRHHPEWEEQRIRRVIRRGRGSPASEEGILRHPDERRDDE